MSFTSKYTIVFGTKFLTPEVIRYSNRSVTRLWLLLSRTWWEDEYRYKRCTSIYMVVKLSSVIDSKLHSLNMYSQFRFTEKDKNKPADFHERMETTLQLWNAIRKRFFRGTDLIFTGNVNQTLFQMFTSFGRRCSKARTIEANRLSQFCKEETQLFSDITESDCKELEDVGDKKSVEENVRMQSCSLSEQQSCFESDDDEQEKIEQDNCSESLQFQIESSIKQLLGQPLTQPLAQPRTQPLTQPLPLNLKRILQEPTPQQPLRQPLPIPLSAPSFQDNQIQKSSFQNNYPAICGTGLIVQNPTIYRSPNAVAERDLLNYLNNLGPQLTGNNGCNINNNNNRQQQSPEPIFDHIGQEKQEALQKSKQQLCQLVSLSIQLLGKSLDRVNTVIMSETNQVIAPFGQEVVLYMEMVKQLIKSLD